MNTKETNSGYRQLYDSLVDCILKGQGHSPQEQRWAAFNNADLPEPLSNLADKVANHAYKVTDDDIEVVKKTGVSEDELFELIICAAVGQASRQYENGLAALAEVMKEGGKHAS